MNAPERDPTSHPSVAEIADQAEGLLPPDRSDAVEAHLATCTDCAGIERALSTVAATLRAAPDPEPMPPEVAARLDRALADARAGARSAGALAQPADLAEEATAAPVISLSGRRPLALSSLLAAAATVGVVALGGYAALATLSSGTGDDEAATQISAERATGAQLPGAVEGGEADARAEAQPDTGAGAGLGAEAADEGASVPLLDTEIDRLVDETARLGQAPVASDGGPSSAPLPRGCGTALARELEATLVAADWTTYLGEPAVLVVVTGGDPSTVEGWVVPDCSSGRDLAWQNVVAPAP